LDFIFEIVGEPQEMIPFEWEIFPCIQLDYVFSLSKIPIPVSNPLVDEHHAIIELDSAGNNAGIGLARGKV
jgi:hypothetical protein